MIKCSEVRHFSMKFPSEGEFWHCHPAGNKLGASNLIRAQKQANVKSATFCATCCMYLYKIHLKILYLLEKYFPVE